MTDLWRRLKQRKLVQWAVAYVAAAFALLQGIDIVAQQFGWAEGIQRGITLAMVLGFFVVLLLAWYHGERGEQKVSSTELLLIALVLAVGGGLIWRFAGTFDATVQTPAATETRQSAAPSVTGQAIASKPIPPKSIAVLPLVNQSGEKDQQYFSDGLSEDLIIALTQFTGLKVISRNSSFQFRDSKQSSTAIGQVLGVAHLLAGSVQRIGDQVRIRAELVNSADGSTVWSQQYDRDYKDLFKLQDEITQAVAGVLKAKLLDDVNAVAQDEHPPSGNLEAYNAFLQGQFHAQRSTEADLRKGISYYRQAIQLDTHYAAAQAGLALVHLKLLNFFLNSPTERQQALAAARSEADKALSLQPDLAAAHRARARVLLAADFDWQGERQALQRALQLAPNDSQIQAALGYSYSALGDVRHGVALVEQAIDTDPLCAECYLRLAFLLPALGRYDDAVRAAQKSVELEPGNDFSRMAEVLVEAWRGDFATALRLARKVPPGPMQDNAMAIALAQGSDRAAADAALAALIKTFGGAGAYQVAEVHGLRGQPDEMFAWLDRAYVNRDTGLTLLLSDVGILRYKDDPRFAAFCRKVGLPVPGEAETP